MPEALARHDAIARTAISDGGGRLFKHTGDGVCAAFGDAPAALAAAVALQRAMDGAWQGNRPRLRVRVALDSGPAYQRDIDVELPSSSIRTGWAYIDKTPSQASPPRSRNETR